MKVGTPPSYESTRRAALAVGAAAFLGSAGRAARAANYDVVIVGAGAAGLAAARRLRSSRLSCVVLEARGRVGGRVHLDRRLGEAFDAGAHYIHWSDRNPWTALATELGFTTGPAWAGGGFAISDRGTPLGADERLGRRAGSDLLDRLLDEATGPDRSIAALAAPNGPAVAAAASGMTLLSLGEEPERVSVADYNQLWEGDDLVVSAGYGALVERYGEGLPVRLGQVVRSIDYSGPGVLAETASGNVRARAAIVTASVGVLRSGAIAFRPGLPEETGAALDGLRMGAYTKVALRLDRSAARPGWTLDLAPDGAAMVFDPQPGAHLLLAYLGGDFARKLCEAGEATVVEAARERLRSIYGSALAASVTAGVVASWWTDPFARGSYSVASPGRSEARLELRRPAANRVWFAGEASAGGGAMTAGGALLDGERAADAVAKALSP